MAQMKTPGVYIVEKNAFPNTVVEVATAVPAFIGYTESAANKSAPLANVPWRITSMAEFRQYFGGPPTPKFEIKEKTTEPQDPAFISGGKKYLLTQSAGAEGGRFLLYFSMHHFFQNGGGPCYVVSVGAYADTVAADKLTAGIDALLKEQEPTMVVIPECVLLAQADAIAVQQAALSHCGEKMRNRIAILDVWGGDKPRQDPSGDCVARFRDALGVNNLDFAAAYYPWVNTTVVQDTDVGYENISNKDLLTTILQADLGLAATPDDKAPPRIKQQQQALADMSKDWSTSDPKLTDAAVKASKALVEKTLRTISPLYNTIVATMRGSLNLLPPAAAMAGVYTMVDNARGVWKAPANVSLNGVISPAVTISNDDQEDLNIPTQGKAVNAIRAFIGEGVLVWGARTLDGNSADWRYINVRRTMIMLEESCRLAAKAMVFEPNVANTWVTIKSMIQNFLTDIWKRGGLAGAVPDDAFSVHCGLGETMTGEDILSGILRVTVFVAISRPAEFIEITFQQQMQKS
jgi:phage tail sheath protein FI